MSPADGAAPEAAAAEKDAPEALRRLAVKGAYAVPAHAGAGFAIFSPRNAFAHALAAISPAAFALARRRAWIAPDPETGRYCIAAAGMNALRRIKSDASAATVAGPPKAKGLKKPKRQGAASVGGTKEGSLAWLRRRRDKGGQSLITEPQFAAGERLGADFWRAQLSPRVTADWSGTASSRRTPRAAPGAGTELGDHVVAARQRVHKALHAVGPELAGILVEVCCHDVGLEAAGCALGWPPRSAKVVLQLALTSLARHYGLISPERHLGDRRLRHWGSEDYRPDIEAWR
jgi:hypothetical protein